MNRLTTNVSVFFEALRNVKTGPCISAFNELDEEERHNSCNGCPLQPAINIYQKGKKKVLKGAYITLKERRKNLSKKLKEDKLQPGIKGELQRRIELARSQGQKINHVFRVQTSLEILWDIGKIPKKPCYAINGRVRQATKSIVDAALKSPEKYIGIEGLKYRLQNRLWKTKIVRLGTIGEFSSLPKNHVLEIVKLIRSSGLTVIGYTHKWYKNDHLKDSFRASCDNRIALKKALEKGWKCQFSISAEKITGRFMEVIPGIQGRVCDFYSDTWVNGDKKQKNNPITDCNTCQACKVDGDSPDIIIMPFH